MLAVKRKRSLLSSLALFIVVVAQVFVLCSCKVVTRFDVVFDAAGGTRVGGGALEQSVFAGNDAEAPTLEREGYEFNGWSDSFSKIMKNTTVTAKWTKLCSVTFDPAGGNIVSGSAQQYVGVGASAAAPSVEKDGCLFSGWDGSFDSVSSDITVSAIWKKHYSVSFDLDGGMRVGGGALEQSVLEGDPASAPEAEKAGFVFEGWDKTFSSVKEDTVVKALWSEKVYTSSELYEKSAAATVEIHVYDENGDGLALGSGFFINDSGTIVTNYHVIADGYSADVTLSDGTVLPVDGVLGYDESLDLAELSVSAETPSYFVISHREVVTGDPVYALGSSLGLTGTFSDGIISSASRDVDGVNCIQTTAAISHGNSGGPLINVYGEVIGVNSMTVTDAQNLNFAINISELDRLDLSVFKTLSEVAGENVYFTVLPYDIPIDEQEPNNSFDTAQALSENGVTVSAYLDNISDLDFFYVPLNGSCTLNVAVFPQYVEDISLLCVYIIDSNETIYAAAGEGYVDNALFCEYDFTGDENVYIVIYYPDDYPYSDGGGYDLFVFCK